jgi:hypothetical protein
MFEVTAEETIALAEREGLQCLVNAVTPSTQANRPDVSWTRLAFRKALAYTQGSATLGQNGVLRLV